MFTEEQFKSWSKEFIAKHPAQADELTIIAAFKGPGVWMWAARRQLMEAITKLKTAS